MDDDSVQRPARRRGPGGVLLAVLALVLVFAAVPLTSSSAPPERADSAPTTAAGPELFDLPPQGSLADDEDFLAGLVAAVPPDALPPERHVVLATELAEERVALVLGRDSGGVHAAWLTGAPDAGPSEMTAAVAPHAVIGREPQALWDVPELDWTGGVLGVVAPPGAEGTFAPGRTVHADGTEGFDPQPLPRTRGGGAGAGGPPGHADGRGGFDPQLLPRTEGVAAGPVGPPVGDTGSLVTVQHGLRSYVVTPLLSDRARQVADAPIEPADPRGVRDKVDHGRLQSLLHDMAGAYGLPAAVLGPVLLAVGPVGDADQAFLVGATLPTGATVAWLGVAGTGTADVLVRTASTVPAPTGSAVTGRVLAVPAGWAVSRLPVPRGDAPPGWLVISGPRDGTTAELLSPAGRTLGALPLVDGAGTGPAPQGTAAVRVLDGSGTSLAGSPLTQLAD